MTSEVAHPLLRKVDDVIANHPDRIAIIDKDGVEYSYATLSKKINYCRQVLKEKGVRLGTKVLVAVPMTIELYAILLALFSLGGIAVFLDPWLKGKQMGQIIRKAKPELMIISSRLRILALLLPATWSIKSWWGVKKLKELDAPWSKTPVTNEDLALITFTGGTGGFPKGADRTFGFLAAQLDALEDHLVGEGVLRDYTNFPIVGLADLAMGNTVIVPSINLMKIHESDPSEVSKSLELTKANRLIVSPALLKKAVQGFIQAKSSHGIKEVLSGGAPISFELIETCLDNFPQVEFEAIFGSTEAEPISVTSFDKMRQKMTDPLKGVFVGTPGKKVRVRIIEAYTGVINAAKFEELTCQPGEVGELIVTGDHVNKNYFEDQAAFEENKIIDSEGTIWHRSGDMAYFDNEDMYLVGRLHRIMSYQNKVLHPYPIEFLVERKFGLMDIGYIKSKEGQFFLYIGGQKEIKEAAIREAIQNANYPIDKIIARNKALPRDPRHRSKLDLSKLGH